MVHLDFERELFAGYVLILYMLDLMGCVSERLAAAIGSINDRIAAAAVW